MPGPNYASRDYPGPGSPEATEAVAVRDEPVVEMTTPKVAKHVGGGWYELSDGTRVQGKTAATEAQAKL